MLVERSYNKHIRTPGAAQWAGRQTTKIHPAFAGMDWDHRQDADRALIGARSKPWSDDEKPVGEQHHHDTGDQRQIGQHSRLFDERSAPVMPRSAIIWSGNLPPSWM